MMTALSAWSMLERASGLGSPSGFFRLASAVIQAATVSGAAGKPMLGAPSLKGLPGACVSLLRALGVCSASVIACGLDQLGRQGDSVGVVCSNQLRLRRHRLYVPYY